MRIRACWYAASRSSNVMPAVLEPADGERDLFNAFAAAAFAARDIIRTGPMEGAGEADNEVVADEEARLETDVAESGTCMSILAAVKLVAGELDTVGDTFPGDEAFACMLRLRSDIFATRATGCTVVTAAVSGVGGGANDAIRMEGLRKWSQSVSSSKHQ